MKKIHITLLFTALWVSLLGVFSCTESDLNQLPSTVKTFVLHYFPGVDVASYTTNSKGIMTVALKNDATLVFNSSNDWIEIQGNGSPLPAELILDQLPAPLYEYLESIEQVDKVYWLKRDSSEIEVGVENTQFSYDLMTQTVVYPQWK